MRNIKQYKLQASIHTIAIKCKGLPGHIDEKVAGCIKASSRRQASDETTYIINPNKLRGLITSYGQFQRTLNEILTGAGIEDYKIVRVDMSFDSYDPQHYERFAKLNRYLISAMAVTYAVKNCYRSTDLFSQKQLSVAIKSKYLELENYDKAAESEGRNLAMSRLEERSKYWTDNHDIRTEFETHWWMRWQRAILNLNEVWQRYNYELEKIYNTGIKSDPCKFRSLSEFLMQYQDCIFCKTQMIDLLSRFDEIGPDRAKTRAENHKKRYGIEYFSDRDVSYAINEIQRATKAFFAEDVETCPDDDLEAAWDDTSSNEWFAADDESSESELFEAVQGADQLD